MFNVYRLLFLILILTMSFNTIAGHQHLLSATTQEDKDVVTLTLNTSDETQDILSVNFKVTTPKGIDITDKDFLVENISEGFVLLRKRKKDIVRLVSNNFSPHNGGPVILDCLKNGINGTRLPVEFDLSRDGDKWNLTFDGKPVSKLHFISNRVRIIGSIGIRKILIR